jgi:RimJ/RimL family protein N-acetyltransferase
MMFCIETPRLILRDILPSDEEGMFRLDSDPRVHRYLGGNTIKTMEEARNTIAFIRRQYADHGIGRWAAIEKASGDFIGWAGLKFITTIENGRTHFHDVGYRLLPAYWGRGYATESAKASLAYAFTTMGLPEVVGTCHELNKASRHILEKCGLTFKEQYFWKDLRCDWLSITKGEWADKMQTR